MGKRILCFLLALVLGITPLAGCTVHEEPPTDGPGLDPQAVWDVPEEIVDAAQHCVILRRDYKNAFVFGENRSFSGPAPSILEEILMIPAGFVAEALGGSFSWEAVSGTADISCRGTGVKLTADSASMEVEGSVTTLPAKAVAGDGDILVPAGEYCQALGLELVEHPNGMVFLGEDIREPLGKAVKSDDPDTSLFLSGIHTQLGASGVVWSPEEIPDYGGLGSEAVVLRVVPPYCSEEYALAASTGSLFIEDLQITGTVSGDHDCSMTVYNYQGYCYGIVEVYDEKDNLVQSALIEPFEGQKASFVDGVKNVYTLVTDIASAPAKEVWNQLSYRTTLNSSVTKLSLVIPQGGYLHITCNPGKSETLALYDSVHLVVETLLASKALASLGKSEATSVKKILKEELVNAAQGDKALRAELAELLQLGFLRSYILSGKMLTPGEAKKIAKSLQQTMERMKFDLADWAENLAKDYMKSGVDTAFKELANTFAASAVFSWELSTNLSNIICLLFDIYGANQCGSLIIETGYPIVTMTYKKSTLRNCATITGQHPDGRVLWTVETPYFQEMWDVYPLYAIGQYKDRFYYLEMGDLVCISAEDGHELWRNEEHTVWGDDGSDGSRTAFIADDGRVFLTGRAGAALWVVSKYGTTRFYSKDFSDYGDYEFCEGRFYFLEDGSILLKGASDTYAAPEVAEYTILLDTYDYYIQVEVAYPWA